MRDDSDSLDKQATQAIISFDSRTLRLTKLLTEKSEDLANMLKGAWITLNASENPDMLSQVSHSMRELIEKAPYEIPEVPVEQDDSGSRKAQIVALIQTYNGLNGQQTPAQILTTQLNILWTLRDLFMLISHHRKPDTTVDEVRQAIVQFEECLLNLMNPEPIPDLNELDVFIKEGETNIISEDLLNKTLEKINKTPVAYSYFFNKVNNNLAWLLPLREKGFFTNPTPAIREDGYVQFPLWPESGYLVRIADKAQDKVLEIIEALPGTDNERVMDDVVHALLKIDTKRAFKLTETVKKYVNSSQFLLLHHTASDFVCKLADDGYDRPAIGLAKEMLEVLPDPEKDEKLKSDYVIIKPATKYRDHDYKDIVEKITPSLIGAAPLATIDMYTELLQKALDYELTFFKEDSEEAALEEKKDDLSYIWRPDIAEDSEYSHNPEDVLTTALRDSVVGLMINDSINDTDKVAKLKELSANKYSIFKRAVEFGLREYKNDQAFKSFYDSLVSDEKLKRILEGEKNGVGKSTFGTVTEKPTKVLEDLPDAELIEKLKTYKDESGWSFERYSITKELAELVKNDPKRFAPLLKDIAAAKNEYLNEVVQAFEEVADSLDEDSVIQMLITLTEIYKSRNSSEKKERHDYYEWSKSNTIRLIEKLASQRENKSERITVKSLSNLMELLLVLCRSEDPTNEDELDLEPADLSINSTRGKAVHAIAYLLAWMHRNKAKKALYKSVFDELEWHLDPDNDPSPAIRAVYGWRLEFLYGIDKDWVAKNIRTIFSDDRLGEAAFDAYARFAQVHPDELEILGNVFVEKLPRLATPPVDDSKKHHDALRSYVQRLALHYWYHNLDLSEGSMMSILLSTADVKYIKELANFIGFRLYKSKGDKPKKDELKKLMKLWEAIAKRAQEDDTKVEALEEFGSWFASGKFDPKWSLEQLAYSALKAGEIHLDFATLEYMETLAEKYPTESLRALSAMVDGAKEHWSVASWKKNATSIIQTAYDSSDDSVKQLAADLANKLVAKGYIEYRSIVSNF